MPANLIILNKPKPGSKPAGIQTRASGAVRTTTPPASKPPPTAIERTTADLDALEKTDREKRRQIKVLQWEVNEELGPKLAAARTAKAAALAQPAKNERNATAAARQAPEVERQRRARELTWKLGDAPL